jgi:phage FluMu protein Com
MDISRCPKCNKRLITMTSKTGRTSQLCLKCDNVDPMKTDAVKWANSDLANSGRATPSQ